MIASGEKERINRSQTLMGNKKIVILGLDTFRNKNIPQIELMNKQEYAYDIFTNDLLGDSFLQFGILNQLNRLIKLENAFFARLRQLITYCSNNKKQLHHAEVYAGGRFACFYGMICQIFKIKYIVVERGDLKSIIDGYKLKLNYNIRPDDKTIKTHIIYLYVYDGILEYAIKNQGGHIERIQISHLLEANRKELVDLLSARSITNSIRRLNPNQKKALFKITSERDHTLNELPYLYRLTFQYVYKFATAVWYKEPYMDALLKKMRIERRHLIANAVDLTEREISCSKDIDFIWVNRIVHRRNFEWIVNHFHDKVLLKTVALGCMDEHLRNLPSAVHGLLDNLKGKEHFEIHGYIQPYAYYQRAKFFVLPATFVFGNYSLLEAMSYGVVPIVSETEATQLIVQNNVNGITFKHDFESFSQAINKAMSIDESTYQKMSNNARCFIKEHFSLEQWANKIVALYEEITVC